MRDYAIEHGLVDLTRLEEKFMPDDQYSTAHQGLVIPCHDVFVDFEGGSLLVKRKRDPAKDFYWPVGGRIKRGMATEDSLRKKVEAECGLQLEDIAFLGVARTFFQTDPFDHGRGTDTLNLVYRAKGSGSLNLDSLHEEPTIITPRQYWEMRDELHPYVQKFMDGITLQAH
jgi:ADP-ribose pyrophosphatase YjhB (NUDIX family)